MRRGGRTRTALLLLTAALIAGLAGLRGGLVEADAVDGEVSSVVLSSDAAGSLTIRWDAPTLSPSDYRLMWAPADQDYLSYRFENEALRGNSYPDGATTSLTLTGLTRGAEFKVRLRSRYRDGQYAQRRWSGPWTDEVTQRVRAEAPAAPTALSATETTRKGPTSISLSWAAPDHSALTGYRIWRGAAVDSLTVLVQDSGDTATGYSDPTTEPGNTYVYAVATLSLDGDSPRSATTSMTRAAAIVPRDEPTVEPTPEPTVEPTPEPTPQAGAIAELTLSSDTRGALEMEWTASDPAPDRYWINWGESHLAFPSLENRSFNFAWTGTDMYFGESIVDAGKTYQVRVRAVYDREGNKAAWNSPWSDIETQRVRSDPPSAPGALGVGVVDHDGVSLSWSAPTHDALTGYRVLRGAGAASLGMLAALGVDARSYTDTATDGATTYHYAVVALSPDGDSPRSSAVRGDHAPAHARDPGDRRGARRTGGADRHAGRQRRRDPELDRPQRQRHQRLPRPARRGRPLAGRDRRGHRNGRGELHRRRARRQRHPRLRGPGAQRDRTEPALGHLLRHDAQSALWTGCRRGRVRRGIELARARWRRHHRLPGPALSLRSSAARISLDGVPRFRLAASVRGSTASASAVRARPRSCTSSRSSAISRWSCVSAALPFVATSIGPAPP